VDNYILQIATTFTDFGQEGKEWRVLYQLKGIDPIDEPRTVVVRFDTEREMLLAWLRLIQNSDPDLVHAYNGWEFDYGYLAIRAKVCGCWDEFRHLGRLKNRPSEMIEKTMSSGAYGDNHWKLLPMSGRLVIDPMVHIKREFKLNFYNLKYVSEWFLSKKMKANPFTITKGSRTVRVRQAGHGFTEGTVVHFSNIDTPEVVKFNDKFFYALAGWSYEDLHGDGDPNSDRSGLHAITRVVNDDEFEFEMAHPRHKDTEGGWWQERQDLRDDA
jgi:DNA polymerase elongation subunit (family B)